MTTIIFFVALFVVVGGMVETGVIDRLANIIVDVTGGEQVMAMLIILWVSACCPLLWTTFLLLPPWCR